MTSLVRSKVFKKALLPKAYCFIFIIFCLSATGFAQKSLQNTQKQIEIANETQPEKPGLSSTFNAPVVIGELLKVRIVHSADLDNDGDMDILTGSENIDRVNWLENLGNLSFQSHVISTTTNGASKIITADLDNDGDTDIISASFSSSIIYWFENLGNKQFTQHILASALVGRKGIHAVELNGDAYIDIASTSHTNRKVAWHQNNGGIFSTTIISNGGVGHPNNVHAGDIDGNGAMDLLVSSLSEEKFVAFRNNGQGQFFQRDLLGFREEPSVIKAADLDGDGDTDIVAANKNHIIWLKNLGQLNFEVHNIISFIFGDNSDILDIDIADLDNDGDLDLMSSSTRLVPTPYNNNFIYWYKNNGVGSFSNHRISSAVSIKYPISIHATDLDNDADMDILFASQEENKIFFCRNLSQLTPPTVNFVADVTSGVAPLSVSFIDNSVGTYTNWHWEFGDGGTSSFSNPVHTYQTPGAYTVSLSVGGPAGSDTFTREDYITAYPVLPPVPNFAADTTAGAIPLTIQFTDSSSGDIFSWFWEFGDSGFSIDQNPTHVYTDIGSYSVSLTTTGAGGSNVLTRENYIQAFYDPTEISTEHETLISGYKIYQNYPNPFNPGTTIQYDLPKAGYISLQVFDIQGKLVANLMNAKVSAGTHRVNWDGKNSTGKTVGSGVYVYQLRASDKILRRKMLLIR